MFLVRFYLPEDYDVRVRLALPARRRQRVKMARLGAATLGETSVLGGDQRQRHAQPSFMLARWQSGAPERIQ